MASTYTYRCYKTFWGIYVGMTAEFAAYAGFTGAAVEVVPGVYIATERAPVSGEEFDYLKLAVRLVENELREKLADRLPVVINILSFDITRNDYDEEGMVYVMLGWLRQETGITFSLPDPEFDKTTNRYIFNFPPPGK